MESVFFLLGTVGLLELFHGAGSAWLYILPRFKINEVKFATQSCRTKSHTSVVRGEETNTRSSTHDVKSMLPVSISSSKLYLVLLYVIFYGHLNLCYHSINYRSTQLFLPVHSGLVWAQAFMCGCFRPCARFLFVVKWGLRHCSSEKEPVVCHNLRIHLNYAVIAGGLHASIIWYIV
jgi:hypothetical protein